MERLIRNTTRLLGFVALCTAMSALAHSYKLKGIEVDHPFATPTVPGAPTGAVYLTLANQSKAPDRLLGASTPRANRVELHSMSMTGDIMRMREVQSIDVNPGQPVPMQPNAGHHFMLVGLGAPLKLGERFPLTLRFEKAGTLRVEVYVEPLPPAQAARPEAPHQH